MAAAAPPAAAPFRTGRRTFMAAGLVAAGWPARAAAPARLLVPGPPEAPLADWGRRLAAALARAGGAGPGLGIAAEALGGPDGVTAANRFATAANPDGRTLLVLAGAAAQARLAGDPRARFDPAGWLPVCAVERPGLLVARAALPQVPLAQPLRLALPAPDHALAAVLLALDLLGIAAQPVFGVAPEEAGTAILQGAADAAVLLGADPAGRGAAMALHPWFTLGPGTEAVAGLLETLAPRAPRALVAAVGSAAAAAQCPAAVVLPALTPADPVARWRAAAARWMEEETGPGGAAAARGRALSGPDAAGLLLALAPPAEALAGYRAWLLQRLRWRAG